MYGSPWNSYPHRWLREGRVQCEFIYRLENPMPPTDHSIDNSAVVLAGPHYDDPYLPQRLATALAGYYDLHPRDFKVLRLERNIGDLLVEFPDFDLCRRAVLEGYFILANGTEMQLKQWTPATGMVQDSMPYRARVKLYDVPLHNRNKRDINNLIAGVGYVDVMAPVIRDDTYKALRVLIACHHPKNILQDLLPTTRTPHWLELS